MKKLFLSMCLLFGLQTIAQKTPPPLNKTIQGNQSFANKMLVKLFKTENANFLFSPFSISSALAITYEGANGKTKTQMSSTMNFTSKDLKEEFKTIFETLKKNTNEGFELNIANALWIQKNFALLDDYVKIAKEFYNAGLDTLDFVKEPEESRIIINDWIADKTNQKILNMILPGILGSSTRLVITNAIYMNAKWATPFDKSRSSDNYFNVNNKEKIITPFMAQMISTKYFENNLYQVVELPYQDNAASMIIVLPKTNIKQLEKVFNNNFFNSIIASMKEEKVEVIMPKFKIESAFEMSKILTSMGMIDAFTNKADFSLMNGRKNLLIDKILHKAFMEVSEEGTIAAAATVVVMREKGIMQRNDFKKFLADKPFLYFIKENKTGSILFAGRLSNPKI